MKRLLTIGLMLASAFALTNCSDQFVSPDQVTPEGIDSPESSAGVPFKIYASVESEADTKTQVYKEGTSLKTKWVEGDKILAVYEKNNSGTFSKPIEFTIDPQELSAGIFTGNIPEEVAYDEDNKYNWYFTYGATIAEDNAGVATINIPSAQSQNTAAGSELAHIGGISCPMYGQALSLSGSIFPRVQMKHLATLYEVSVRNDTETNEANGTRPGNIVVYSFGINTPTAGSWQNNTERLKLTGNFKLDLKNGTLKNLGNNTDNITLQLPANGVTIEQENSDPDDHNNEYKFYFVSAPIDNLQIGATYESYYLTTDPTSKITVEAYNALSDTEKQKYTGNILRKDELQFVINGSVRSTVTDKTLENFTGGKVKKFILPVRSMQRPINSDALNITSKGRLTTDAAEKVLTIVGPQTTYINGSETPIFVVGSTTEPGKIIIKGFAKEMLNALPIGFYASRWNNNPTAMTVRSINIDMPIYPVKGRVEIFGVVLYEGTTDYSDLQGRQSLSSAYGDFTGIIGWDLSGGLSRTLMLNSIGIDANTITFNGLVPSNDFEKGNVVIIDEEPVHKAMSVETIEGFIKRFGEDATLAGLKDIVNAEFEGDKIKWSDEATATGKAIYDKIYSIVLGKISSGTLANLAMKTLNLSDYEALMYTMRDMKFEIVIETYPYAPVYTTTELTSGYQPIVFWGLDAAGTITQ